MAKVIIKLPDDLARSLGAIAATRRTSVQQLALEALGAIVHGSPEPRTGSAAALLRAMREPPHLSVSDVDELDAAIASGRLRP